MTACPWPTTNEIPTAGIGVKTCGPTRPECLNSWVRLPLERPVPKRPSAIECEKHCLTHVPFAGWCEACIAGRGVESQHRATKPPDDPVRPVVQMDYTLMHTKEPGDSPLTVLSVCNQMTGQGLAVALPGKEVTEYCVKAVETYLKDTGVLGGVSIQTDGENTITALAVKLAERHLHVSMRQAPVGSSAS